MRRELSERISDWGLRNRKKSFNTKSAFRYPHMDQLYIAVDLGAGSGRVFLAGVAPGELLLEEMRRFQYPPVHLNGHLRWELPKIFDEIKSGARKASERARELRRPIRSIGVDSWGVDYGLIDAEEELIEDPICYRDERTQGTMEQVFARIPREEIFQRTGIQFLNFNTLFQLYAHAQAGIPGNASRLLLISDLINYFLSGKTVTEFTNATTTQLVNSRTGTWDCELIARLRLPAKLLSEIVTAGRNLGPVKPALVDELGLDGVQVVAPATHDTGSAIVGAPLQTGWAYISSGTWSLVGVERSSPLINEAAAGTNFTNEGGAFGTTRFLKNVMGLWILESCRKEWQRHGADIDYDILLDQVAAVDSFPGLIFPDDARFFNPPSMLEAIATQLNESGQCMPVDPPSVVKIILDSLAFRYASVLSMIELLTNQKIEGVQIIGGGSHNAYLNQATANATDLPVLAGPAEATVMGNLLVQAISGGRFASLAEARQHIADNVRLESFMPRVSAECEQANRRYADIEARFAN